MPRTLEKALNAKTVAAITQPGAYADGNGLALKVDVKGNKRWLWRGTIDGRACHARIGRLSRRVPEGCQEGRSWAETGRQGRAAGGEPLRYRCADLCRGS